jgi:type IV secretory pathway TrbL component
MNLNTLSPQQKAFISVAVLLISAFLGAGLVALIVHFGLFLYVGYAMIIFGLYGLIKVVYELELAKFERQEQTKKG